MSIDFQPALDFSNQAISIKEQFKKNVVCSLKFLSARGANVNGHYCNLIIATSYIYSAFDYA